MEKLYLEKRRKKPKKKNGTREEYLEECCKGGKGTSHGLCASLGCLGRNDPQEGSQAPWENWLLQADVAGAETVAVDG